MSEHIQKAIMPPGSPPRRQASGCWTGGAGEEVSAHAPGGAAGARIRTDGGEALDPRVGRGARWSVPTDRAPAPEAAAGCAVLAGHGGGEISPVVTGARRWRKRPEYPPPGRLVREKKAKRFPGLSGFLCSCFCWPGECCPLWGLLGERIRASRKRRRERVSPCGPSWGTAGACIQRSAVRRRGSPPSGCSSPSTPSGRRFCTTAR